MAGSVLSTCNGGDGGPRAEPNLRIRLKAKAFSLKATDGKTYSFEDVRGAKGTLVVFICNHCPYVRAVIDRFVEEANALKELGIGVIAVMPNDTKISPGD